MKKYLFIMLITFSFVSCKKETASCETWETMDYCIPKSGQVACAEPTYNTYSVCGDDLKLAKAGKEKIRLENADVKLMTKYIRQK